jgi:hypothetical protein
MQYIEPAGTFHVFVVGVLLVVPAYFVWAAESSARVIALMAISSGSFLIGSEGIDVDVCSVAGRGNEFGP